MVDAVTERNVLGPTYLPVWRKVFSPQHPPVTLRGMVAKVLTQAGSSSLPPHAALCFRGEVAAKAACPAGLTHTAAAVASSAACWPGLPSIQYERLPFCFEQIRSSACMAASPSCPAPSTLPHLVPTPLSCVP